jgi:hypothetical protein
LIHLDSVGNQPGVRIHDFFVTPIHIRPRHKPISGWMILLSEPWTAITRLKQSFWNAVLVHTLLILLPIALNVTFFGLLRAFDEYWLPLSEYFFSLMLEKE